MNLIAPLNNLSIEELNNLKEKVEKYKSILFEKEGLNMDEINLWFDFMGECFKTPYLSLMALQLMCENLLIDETYINHIVLSKCDNDDKFAFGYVNNFNGMEWNKSLYAIDTLNWDVVIKDINTAERFNMPIKWLSNEYIVSIIANFRTITKKTLNAY